MPRQAASACPLEDVLASWAPTPGSDHRLIGRPSRSFVSQRQHPLFCVVSAPHPSPSHTGSVLTHAHASTLLEWDGTREPMCF